MPKDTIPQGLQQKDYHILKECARSYILSGRTLAEICDHNERVARRLGKQNVSTIWQFVKIIYSSMPKQATDLFRNSATSQNLLLNNRMLMAATNLINAPHWTDESTDDNTTHTNETIIDEFKARGDFTIPKVSDFSKLAINQTSAEDETIDALNNIVYGDKELTVENMDCIKSLRNGFLYIGPHDLTKNFSWPSDSMMNHDMQQNSRNQALSRNRHDTSPVVGFRFSFSQLLQFTMNLDKKKKKFQLFSSFKF